MDFLLKIARLIDKVNDRIGLTASWALLAAVVICVVNALISAGVQSLSFSWLAGFRQSYTEHSNSWLEIQWYLFSAVFLLASAHTLRRNEHVRIDILAGRLSKRAQVWIDIFGFVLFLLPICGIIFYYAVPYALVAFHSGENTGNAGGLVAWPARCLIPAGFFLLILQGISELIKRIGWLLGRVDASEFEKHAQRHPDEIGPIKSASRLN